MRALGPQRRSMPNRGNGRSWSAACPRPGNRGQGRPPSVGWSAASSDDPGERRPGARSHRVRASSCQRDRGSSRSRRVLLPWGQGAMPVGFVRPRRLATGAEVSSGQLIIRDCVQVDGLTVALVPGPCAVARAGHLASSQRTEWSSSPRAYVRLVLFASCCASRTRGP